MSDPHHPPAGEKGSVGKAWGFAILFIVVVMSGVIGSFFDQVGEAFEVVKRYTPQILILVALVGIISAIKKPPPSSGH